MRETRAKEIRNNVLKAMYKPEDIKTSKKLILQDRQFKKVYRAAKKNYMKAK